MFNPPFNKKHCCLFFPYIWKCVILPNNNDNDDNNNDDNDDDDNQQRHQQTPPPTTWSFLLRKWSSSSQKKGKVNIVQNDPERQWPYCNELSNSNAQVNNKFKFVAIVWQDFKIWSFSMITVFIELPLPIFVFFLLVIKPLKCQLTTLTTEFPYNRIWVTSSNFFSLTQISTNRRNWGYSRIGSILHFLHSFSFL